MPNCNMCGEWFDVEKEPGALIFGHPSTVKEAVSVWKAHICQGCETKIIDMFKLKPGGNKPQELDSSLPADMGGNVEKAKGKLGLKLEDWETLFAFLDQLPEFSKDMNVDKAKGKLELGMDDWETLLTFLDQLPDFTCHSVNVLKLKDVKRVQRELEEQFVDMEETEK